MNAAFRYLRSAAGDYLRQAAGVRELALAPSVRDPIARLGRQLVQRELRFLELVLRSVFERGDNPYFHMFRMAGCGYEDLVEITMQQGLEAALSLLHKTGVYLTQEELSGVRPVVRHGREIAACRRSFANPLLAGHPNVHRNVYFEGYELLQRREFGLAGRPRVELSPIPPSTAGLDACLRAARRGWHVDQWFAPDPTHGREARQWMGVRFLVGVARAHGASVPFPTPLPENDYAPVSRYLAASRANGAPASLGTTASYAVRVADASLRAGHDISGTLFLAGGEAVSAAKQAVVRAAGAAIYPMFSIPEVGPAGFACREMERGDSVHLFEDSVAVITHRREAPLTGEPVDSLLFTTLLPAAPLVLINFESGDAGAIERAACRCSFRGAGFHRQLRGVQSFGRLTALGAPLIGADLSRLIEGQLPRHFGGAPGDYQLAEREGPAQTEVVLRVSPRAAVASCEAVKQFVWSQMPRLHSGWVASRAWRHCDAFQVEVAEPNRAPSGKVPPVELLRHGR